ncbi:MAG: DEAD/DEAH box helicase, partial [Gammaproteobacteria bacterium]
MDSYRLHNALAEGNWRSDFDYRALQRAAGYVRDERVLSVIHETLDPQTETLTGAVQGTASRPYLCALELRNTRGGLKIRTHCDCPVGFWCKHAAAILIAASRSPPQAWPGSAFERSAPPRAAEPQQTANGEARRAIEVTPAVPVLSLRALDAKHFPAMRSRRPVACARVSFDYGGQRLDPAIHASRTRHFDNDGPPDIQRDGWGEETALERLEEAGFDNVDLYVFSALPRQVGLGAYDFVLRPNPYQPPLAPEDCGPVLAELADDGFRIEYEAGFPYQELVEIDDWEAELGKSGNAWFEVALGVTINGERVDLLPVLRRVLADPGFSLTPEEDEDPNASRRIRLDAGRDVEIPLARLRQLVAPLLEWLEQGEGGKALRVHATEAATLRALTRETKIAWRGVDELEKTLALLRGAPRALDAPAGFRATLRPYQREGLAWLNFLSQAGLGGALADDMGLGKTVQVLAHILAEKTAGRLSRPVLVVAPTSLIGNWREEAARFAPALKVLVLHGANRARRYAQIDTQDLVVTTYPLLPRDRERLLERQFSLLVLDEAQAIKNPHSQAARVVREILATRRLAVTGTPLENHLGELWAQF